MAVKNVAHNLLCTMKIYFSAGNNSRSSDIVRPIILKMFDQIHIMIGQDDRTSHQHILSYLLQGVASQ